VPGTDFSGMTRTNRPQGWKEQHHQPGCSGAGSVNVASFVLCGCPIVAKTAIPTSGAARIADIAIRFWDHMALSRDQKKLFPHFGEAGTAVFAVKEVEYGGHDRNPVV
jgi:hypothetical protein